MYPLLLRVQFNDLWIEFHNSSQNFHESHSSRKHFTNDTELKEHKILVLKPTSKYQIIWQWWFTALSISLLSKNFGNIIFFTEPEISNWREKTINCSNIYLLFDLLWCQKSISWNYSIQGSLICPVVWKCIILKNYHGVQN